MKCIFTLGSPAIGGGTNVIQGSTLMKARLMYQTLMNIIKHKKHIYLMQIQGSAVAVLDDGSSVRIRYADNNGHNFVGIGSILLKKGFAI